MLGEEPTRRRGVVVEAVGAAAAFMVDGASLFALVFGLDIIFCVRRWQRSKIRGVCPALAIAKGRRKDSCPSTGVVLPLCLSINNKQQYHPLRISVC